MKVHIQMLGLHLDSEIGKKNPFIKNVNFGFDEI